VEGDVLKLGAAAGFFACAAMGAIGAYAGNPEGAVGIIGAGLMGIAWGSLLAQVPTAVPGRADKPPRQEALSAYATFLSSLALPVMAFVVGSTVGGTFALWLGLAAVAPAPLGGYCLARLAIHYPKSRARRIIAPEVLFADHPRQ
jgi:hypothetical protein